MELVQGRDSLDSSIQDAISVMLARSKSIGEPYALSYEDLARVVDFPGVFNKDDLETALNNNPNLSAKISNFDESGLEVDATGESSALDTSAPMPTTMPPDLGLPPMDMNAGLPPDMGSAAAPAGAAPAAPAPEALPPAEAPPVNVVKSMADRAAKRRMA